MSANRMPQAALSMSAARRARRRRFRRSIHSTTLSHAHSTTQAVHYFDYLARSPIRLSAKHPPGHQKPSSFWRTWGNGSANPATAVVAIIPVVRVHRVQAVQAVQAAQAVAAAARAAVAVDGDKAELHPKTKITPGGFLAYYVQ